MGPACSASRSTMLSPNVTTSRVVDVVGISVDWAMHPTRQWAYPSVKGGCGGMLSREENELITRTGPGTPMGDVLRRYWMPILLEREVAEPDGEPAQVQVLGERLVAFRDTDGRIGLL